MMDEEDYTININCVVGAVINKRLAKEGYQWQTSPTRSCASNKVIKVLTALCEEFELRYEKQFMKMRNEEQEISYDFYMAVLNELISDGLHWGRLTGILTFACVMAVQCMKTERPEKVDLVREWTSQFIHKNVEGWMNENNGWKGLVEFYESGKKKEEKKGWGAFLTGAGAIGALAVGALIMNKA